MRGFKKKRTLSFSMYKYWVIVCGSVIIYYVKIRPRLYLEIIGKGKGQKFRLLSPRIFKGIQYMGVSLFHSLPGLKLFGPRWVKYEILDQVINTPRYIESPYSEDPTLPELKYILWFYFGVEIKE